CQITATVTVNALPTITGTLIICAQETTQLTGSSTATTITPWVSSNTAVATISSSGLVTGVSAGSTTITYTNSNGCKITDTITVNALPTITGNLGVCIGLTTQLTGSVTPATTNPWFSSNTSVATIDTTGLVTSISVGTTTITYTNSNGCQKNTLVTVNPLPAVIVPATLFECSNGTVTTATFDLTINQGVVTGGLPGFSVTYYTSLTNALNGTSSIVSPTSYTGLDNEDVYLRVENTATGCFSITTQLLRVTNGPLAITPLPLHYCDPNNDGFGVFDLDSTINEIAGGPLPTGVLVTFHETQTDALIGANPYPSPYANLNVNTQTIYVRVFYTLTGCANYVELQLIVDPTPIATEPDDYELCDSTGAVGFESFDLTTTNPQILGSLDPLTHAVTFYTSQAAAQAGTVSITNPTNYSSNTQTIYVRVENTLTGCYDIVTLQLIINPPPNSTQPNYDQYSLCDTTGLVGFETFDLASQVASILLGQTGMDVTFYPSLAEAQSNTNAITNLQYTNADIYVQTLGIRIINTTTGCYVISTMDIRVEPLPTIIPPASYTLCDDNQDGFSCDFDLTTLEADILQGVAYNLSFYETRTGAEIGDPVTAIDTTVPYCTLLPFTQTLWVRAEDPFTGCWSIMPIELNVDPSPVAPVNLNPITVCDQDSNPLSASTLVNLTQQTAAVLAQQTGAATNYTVTYYTSQLLAEQGTAPIIPATSYFGANLQTIWVRVENNNTQCYNLGSFQVFVGIPLVVPTPQPINECDTLPNDQFAVFDLTVRQITALPGYTFQYYPSWTDAQNDTNQITNITSYTNVSLAVQTLGVRIISAQGCVGYTTLNIRVLPAPEPNTNPTVLPAVCEDSTTPGQATIDLTQNESYILNGDPNLSVQYYPTLTDLENDTNQITNPASVLVGDATLVDDPINLVQYVYIAVSGNNTIDHTGRRCYTVVPQGYVINPLPRVDIIGTSNVYQICESDPTGNDNIEIFDLTSQIPDLLEGNVTTPISTYSVAFYETATGSPITNPSAYTNTSSPQPIYVVINNTTTGCSSAVGSFTLQVNPKPVFAIDITTDLNYETCDENDGINDGQTLHNGLPLSDYIDDILGTTQSPADYTVTFHYNSQADAAAGLNAIQDLVTYQLQTGTYWVRIENNLTGCYITDSFAVIVEQLAEPNIVASTNIACVNFGETTVNNTLILESQVTGNYTFEWYAGGNLIPGENGPTLTVTEVTDAQVEFSVIAISNSALQCASDTAPDRTRFTVIRSGLASNLTYTVTNAFSDLQIITVTNDGYGVYHYSLDDGPILDNGGVFTNVPIGTHTVHVWDVRDPNGYSCGEVSIEDLQIIDYPHYFTPNGDGIHDTWNIVGLEGQPGAKIFIFDRYGKLLKQISSTGAGWDGTYNGYRMPSDDYWFTVDYEENGIMKQYKSHFAMKR
ncbi:T9SS type B sorting domain-containing protein, partial [Flavobacterium sp.]|uniref:T9SS type B sorting domain-containing protein n=1 Tax=Flavobacterium sp. TaxID=239 RepID=UPI0037BEEB76